MTNKPESASLREKIEACPLCGAQPVVWDAAGYEVDCLCGLNYCNKTDPSRAAAIAGWNKRAAIYQDGEPVAYMFHVRYDGKGKSSWFAAIDYTVQVGETLISKEPLYTRPATDAAKDARIALCLAACADEDSEYLQFIVGEGRTLRALHDETLATKEKWQRELNAMETERDELRQQLAEQGARLVAAETQALADVRAERLRQVSAEGWSLEHDDEHDGKELAFAAACYCIADPGEAPSAVWPWDWSWWKPRDHRSNCVRATALLLAEIERLDRMVMKRIGERQEAQLAAIASTGEKP